MMGTAAFEHFFKGMMKMDFLQYMNSCEASKDQRQRRVKDKIETRIQSIQRHHPSLHPVQG